MPRVMLSLLSLLSSPITCLLAVLSALSILSVSHALVCTYQGFLRSRLAALNIMFACPPQLLVSSMLSEPLLLRLVPSVLSPS